MKRIDLSRRAKYRITGQDRIRYLNGQVSNDVNKVTPNKSISACVTTAKGKLEGHIWIGVEECNDALLVDTDLDLRESLMTRLSKYIISDDVEITDITDDYLLLHDLEPEDADGVLSKRYGSEGHDHWKKADDIVSGADWMSENSLEEYRILHGIPAWNSELSFNTLPQEALLDNVSVDFHKGCYVGQEIISRLESVGQVKRKLVGLKFNDGPSPEPGWELMDQDNVKVGNVTSVCSREGEIIGLGYVKRDKLPVKTNNNKNNLSSEAMIRHTLFTNSQ